MNHRAVTSDAGVLLGHACGACGWLARPDIFDGMREDPADTYTPEDAARFCCICDHCGRQTERRRAQYCDHCFWKLCGFGDFWRWLGYAIKLRISHPVVWECFMDHFDYGHLMDRLTDALREEGSP